MGEVDSRGTFVATKGESKRGVGKEKKSKKGKILWGNKIKEDISSLILRDEVELYEFLRVTRKFERKCVLQLKKLKGPIQASKLLLLICDILRSLKIISIEISGSGNLSKAKIYAAFGLILTHAISAALRGKCKSGSVQKSALKLFEFIRSILDFNSNWIFTTILSSELVSPNPGLLDVNVSPLSQSLVSLILNDPLLVSDLDIVGRKAKATLLLIASETSKPNFAKVWNAQEGFCQHLPISRVTKIKTECKKRLKIKVPKASRLPIFNESIDPDVDEEDTPGVPWGISTTPGAMYEGSDSDSADSTKRLENTEDASDIEGELEDPADVDSDEPSSKRLRI